MSTKTYKLNLTTFAYELQGASAAGGNPLSEINDCPLTVTATASALSAPRIRSFT